MCSDEVKAGRAASDAAIDDHFDRSGWPPRDPPGVTHDLLTELTAIFDATADNALGRRILEVRAQVEYMLLDWANVAAELGLTDPDCEQVIQAIRLRTRTPDERDASRADLAMVGIGNLQELIKHFNEMGQDMQRLNANLWQLHEGKF